MYVCLYVCVHELMYVCTYVRMHACMYACVCMYVCMGNYVAMWLLNYSGCGTFRDFESDIFMNFRLCVSLACTTEKI